MTTLTSSDKAYIENNVTELLPSKNLAKSPISYPGGKTRAIRILNKFIPKDTSLIISPFFGGGKLEIVWDSVGISVIGYDLFQPVVDFWQMAITDSQTLAEASRKYLGITKPEFLKLQKASLPTKFERAVQFFVLNKSSFSGLTFSGGMSLKSPINTRDIERLSKFFVKNLWVNNLSFENSISLYPDGVFMYLDPPYYLVDKSLCYGINGDMQKGFPHETLSEILKSRKNWLLSYNNREEVRELYKDFFMLEASWSYGMVSKGNYKTETELIIFSDDLANKIKFNNEENT
jgi:DNA adenine methylase